MIAFGIKKKMKLIRVAWDQIVHTVGNGGIYLWWDQWHAHEPLATSYGTSLSTKMTSFQK